WWSEAERHQVLPVDNRPFSDMVLGRPPSAPPRTKYVYRAGRAPVPEVAAVNVKARDHLITAHVVIGDGEPAQGVLAVQGSVLGGWSFHLLAGGRLCYVHNVSGWRTYRAEAQVGDRLTPGPDTLAFRFEHHEGGVHRGVLLVDGDGVGSGEIEHVVWNRFSLTGAGLTVGWARDFSPADTDYRGAFRF